FASCCLVFSLVMPRPPTSPLFPYTTLFRSECRWLLERRRPGRPEPWSCPITCGEARLPSRQRPRHHPVGLTIGAEDEDLAPHVLETALAVEGDGARVPLPDTEPDGLSALIGRGLECRGHEGL